MYVAPSNAKTYDFIQSIHYLRSLCLGYSMIQGVQLVVSVACMVSCLRCFNFMAFSVDNSSGSSNMKVI